MRNLLFMILQVLETQLFDSVIYYHRYNPHPRISGILIYKSFWNVDWNVPAFFIIVRKVCLIFPGSIPFKDCISILILSARFSCRIFLYFWRLIHCPYWGFKISFCSVLNLLFIFCFLWFCLLNRFGMRIFYFIVIFWSVRNLLNSNSHWECLECFSFKHKTWTNFHYVISIQWNPLLSISF